MTKFRKINVLVQGPIGSGKTYSIKSLVECGIEVFVIATEPGIENLLGETDSSSCHWHYIPPANPDWETMIGSAKNINSLPIAALQKMEGNRSEYRQFIEVLETCADFVCDRTGEHFGAVDSWGPERALVCDGMSGLAIMAMDLVAGNKPLKTQGDWGTAMDNLERLVMKLTCSTSCSFIMTAHQDRELDEITGASKVMVSTLGRKLAPKIPRFFDEVVQARRVGKKFFWSNTEIDSELKGRLLPLSDEIGPNFAQLLK